MGSPSLLLFRQDLRLADNPALAAAMDHGAPIIPVFISDENLAWAPGAASRWWLHQSLGSLDASLRERGSKLVLRRGSTEEVLTGLVRETGARSIYWNRRYEPAAVTLDSHLKRILRDAGATVESYNSALLWEPWTVQNKSGKPYRVFTPFWRHLGAQPPPAAPCPAPERLTKPARWPSSESLGELDLEPRIDWATGLRAAWTPGERGALAQLERFTPERVTAYDRERDRPDRTGTSRLSPHLHFGEIGPRQVWERLAAGARAGIGSAEPYLRQLGWREFGHHLMFHFPHTDQNPLRPEYQGFPWRDDPAGLRAWQRGRTGFPIVDAGMRELWTTGWMHNRVRMIVASFLVKDLLLPWQEGARWFWDTLVDADLANNTMGWQWCAGSGADAAPYFRVFNPASQGAKFDPSGDYVRRWVPELAALPARWIHEPGNAPTSVLVNAGLKMGRDYPEPIVDHAAARLRALEAWKKIRR